MTTPGKKPAPDTGILATLAALTFAAALAALAVLAVLPTWA